MKERETTLGYRFIGGAPDKLAAMLRHEIEKWADVANSASLKAQLRRCTGDHARGFV